MPVKVNENGTHIYLITRQVFLNIVRLAYKKSGKVQHRVSVVGKLCEFSRVALECFTNTLLVDGLTCDHEDCNRDNNCFANLSPKGHLFQCNHKSMHRKPVAGKVLGVNQIRIKRKNLKGDYKGWRVNVGACAIDRGAGRTRPIYKYFYESVLGIEGARQAAIAFRQKHTPREHMIKVERDTRP
jgi:hypothetical protein